MAIKPLTGKGGDFSGIVLKAAARGDAEAVRHYLKVNPEWLNQEGPHGRTMLWEAAYKGRTQLVAELIERGGDVNPMGSYYTPMLVELSALAVARSAGRDELVALLEANGAVDDLYAACYRGDLEAIDGFLSNDPEAVNRPSRDEEPHPRMGFHPIHYAVVGQRVGAVKLLVGSGAIVADHLPLLLEWAAGNRELVRYLKQEGKGVSRLVANLPKNTPQPKSNVPAIDRPDWMGFPLLVDACRGNHNAPDDPARVRKLLKRGANVNITDHKQKTPLHRSCQAGFRKITQLLLDNGALLEAVDEKGCTPIFDAALHGRSQAIELMLNHGANIEQTDNRGETPLFAAARGGGVEAFQTLLAAGANPKATNARGKDIAQVVLGARSQTVERREILEILRSIGS